MSQALPTKDELKHKALLVRCETKESLHRWIKMYLSIDLPDGSIDPLSNSSPMDIIWEIYDSMYRRDATKTRFLFYAARDSFKTLSSAIIELLAILHFERDVGHMAAIESQSVVCARYIKAYSALPYIRDYVTQASERRVEYTRYKSASGDVISPLEYEQLADPEKALYTPRTNFVQVVIATPKGANSLHAQLFVLDELDLAPPVPVEESKMIPTQGRDGAPPVVLMTSSRKYGIGLVQKEIDEADERGTLVRHWNLIDVTAPCPTSRHLPDEPRIPIYSSSALLKAISEKDYRRLTPEEKEKYERHEGYAGCLKNCRLFAVCQGRLANQKGRSRMLKGIAHVQNLFRSVDAEVAKAQLMCWKPSSYGMIYPNFLPDLHMITANQIAEKITGERYEAPMGKQELIELAKSRGCEFYSGMDHGYTHNFAVVTGFKHGNRFFVIDVIAAPELELSQKIEVCNTRIKDLNPVIFADPEDPASNKTLKKHFRLRDWKKTPGSVIGGITIVRFKLMPTMGDPELFFLRGDDGCELLKQRVQQYHWVFDKTTGKPTDVPAEENDDECDALRYVIMNLFTAKGKTIVSDPDPAHTPVYTPKQYTSEDWMKKTIEDHIGAPAVDVEEEHATTRGRKGGFFWDLMKRWTRR